LLEASEELKDAMDLAYLTGQRPADILKMKETDIQNGALEVLQNKTRKKLRILLHDETGSRTQLGLTLDRIRGRSRKICSFYLVATELGTPLTSVMLRIRFEKARDMAVKDILAQDNEALAKRIQQFQFRDIRPKAASEIGDIGAASKLLGHSERVITKKVYLRVGETVRPTK
jgi:integrase